MVAGSRPTPIREPNDPKPCNRCGVVWRDCDGHYLPTAPCRDCRDVLRLEGIPASTWQTPRRRAANARSRRAA